MAYDTHKDLAYSTIPSAGGPSPALSGNSLKVQPGDGVLFASQSQITVWPAGTLPTHANAEIMQLNSVSTDTLIVTRAQEGTSPLSVVAGYQVAATISTKPFSDVEGIVNNTLPVFNVKNPTYGAKGDTVRLSDGSITSGTATLTSASANFSSGDVGKVISVVGAGAVNAQNGINRDPIETTILSVQSSTSITLNTNAGATVSGAVVIYGTNDTTAIGAALTAAALTGGIVFCPPGSYRGGSAGYALDNLYIQSNVILAGAGTGATTLYFQPTFGTTTQGASAPLVKNAYLRDFTLNGATGIITAGGINYRNTRDCRIQNVNVVDTPSWLIIGGFEPNVPVSDSIYFENCVFDRGIYVTNPNGQDMTAFNYNDYVSMKNIEFRNNTNGLATLLFFSVQNIIELENIRFVNCNGSNTNLNINGNLVTIKGLRSDGGVMAIQGQTLYLEDFEDFSPDQTSVNVQYYIHSANGFVTNGNLGQWTNNSGTLSGLNVYENYIPFAVNPNYINAASAGQAQLTFNTPPKGYYNGQTIRLDSGALFETAVISSGAGTNNWVLTSNLTRNHAAGFNIQGQQAGDVVVSDVKASYLDLISENVSSSCRLRVQDSTIASWSDGEGYFGVPQTNSAKALTVDLQLDNVRFEGGLSFSFFGPTSTVITYKGHMRNCEVYGQNSSWVSGGWVTLSQNMNMVFEDNYIFNGFLSGSPAPTFGTGNRFWNNRKYSDNSLLAVPSGATAGTVEVTQGGTGSSTQFTSGSVVYADGSGVYNQDNSNFFWDSSNHRLGIGVNSNLAKLLHVFGAAGNGIRIESSGDSPQLDLKGSGGTMTLSGSFNGQDLDITFSGGSQLYRFNNAQMQTFPNSATANSQLNEGPNLRIYNRYWNGTVTQDQPFTLHHVMINTSPKSRVAFEFSNSSTELFSFLSTGLFGVGNNNPGAYVTSHASTPTNASLNIPVGVKPTSPNNGDIWNDGYNLWIWMNGAAYQITGQFAAGTSTSTSSTSSSTSTSSTSSSSTSSSTSTSTTTSASTSISSTSVSSTSSSISTSSTSSSSSISSSTSSSISSTSVSSTSASSTSVSSSTSSSISTSTTVLAFQ